MKTLRALLDSWRRDLAYASRTGGIGDRRVTMAGGRLSVELRSLAACAELVADAMQDDAFAADEAARPTVIAADVEPTGCSDGALMLAAIEELRRGLISDSRDLDAIDLTLREMTLMVARLRAESIDEDPTKRSIVHLSLVRAGMVRP